MNLNIRIIQNILKNKFPEEDIQFIKEDIFICEDVIEYKISYIEEEFKLLNITFGKETKGTVNYIKLKNRKIDERIEFVEEIVEELNSINNRIDEFISKIEWIIKSNITIDYNHKKRLINNYTEEFLECYCIYIEEFLPKELVRYIAFNIEIIFNSTIRLFKEKIIK